MNKIKTFKYRTVPENGILNKITKRYSSVSAKFIKKSPRKSKSPQKITTGSYDINGGQVCEDLKLEIGEPVLISKTPIDTDTVDSKGRVKRLESNTSSLGSDAYSDAVSTLPNVQDIKFEFLPSTERAGVSTDSETGIGCYEIPRRKLQKEKPNHLQVPPLRKNRSKSAQNLHKSELRVYLQKAPSLELDLKLTTANLQNCYDLPRRSEHKTPEASKPTVPMHSYSEPNTPLDNPNFISQFSSSVGTFQNRNTSDSSMCNGGSRDSFAIDSSLENFDMKSASLDSLNAGNIFLSIEELNEITRQINECDTFTGNIDLEYCEHRDSLKPDERRITLLRNKNTPLINFHTKKDKINNAWSGLKNWIGEESGKFKEVVQKHAALQRVGALGHGGIGGSKMSINRTPSMKSSQNVSEISQTSSTLSIPVSVASVHTLLGNGCGGDGGIGDYVGDSERPSIKSNSLRDTSPISKKSSFKDKLEGQNGFEELRRYIKQGGDFGKDLVTILHERVESEQLYAKSLTKMASKLNKACREIPGSIADAWRGVATEMESRSEVHRQFSTSLVEELVKPLKLLLDGHHKTRKSVESNVDKSSRILSEWRVSEAKAKKSSHTAARENEKLQDGMLDVRIQKSPSINLLHRAGANKGDTDKELKNAEKDCAKLDNKRRKAEEAVKRADVEYYTLCIRSERARVDWEMSVLRGSSVLQNLECQRLTNMKNFVSSYLRLTSNMNPVLEQIVIRLNPQVESCNVQKDLIIVKNIRRASEGPSEQLLPDFYCEHTTLAMNRERRKHALIKLLQLVKTDLERERRSRNSLKGISQALNTQDNQSIADKLYHIRSMLTYLEGARFKLHSALLELDHKPRNSHPLAPHIQVTRDRTGLQQSILKVPLWLKTNDKINECKDSDYSEIPLQTNGSCIDIKNEALIKNYDKNFNRSKSSSEILVSTQQICENGKSQTLPVKDIDSPEFDRGIADGGSNQPDSDFDEFSSQDEDDDSTQKDKLDGNDLIADDEKDSGSTNNKYVVLSRCKALYSYSPKLYDELELTPGDIIEVHVKQEDGWWLGALKDRVGIFPATYVEEFI